MKIKKKILRIYLKYYQLILIIFFSAVSIIDWIVFYKKGLTLIYTDAMSHLNISRLVVDNLQPGFSQLGGIWLPLNHILSLSLIWNDWAWHSGFAGSFFSMISYVASSLGVYKIVYEITRKHFASIVGALVFGLNLNILYLQSTPLTEPLFIAIFVYSVLFFVRWILRGNIKNLLIMGVLGFVEVLTRYDGWFIVVFEGLLIVSYLIFNKKKSLNKILGVCTIYFAPIILGIALWILWNILIFHYPLYFLLGPYSAHQQQVFIGARSTLITKGNIFISTLAYIYATLGNVGSILCMLGAIGIIAFLIYYKGKISFTNRLLIFLLLLSPVIFNILSLYFGFSILNMPELNWNPSVNIQGQWFNVRYGILALPLIAVFIGILSSLKLRLSLLMLSIIALQCFIIYSTGIVTIIDGTLGSSSFVSPDIATFLQNSVKKSDKVIMSMSYFSPVVFKSGVDLSQVIHEGVSGEWQNALSNPEDYAKWVVTTTGNKADPVYDSLFAEQKGNFLSYYTLAYKGLHANVYRLKTQDELFVRRDQQQLYLGKVPFTIRGVNLFNLAYLSDSQIADTLKQMHNAGVNTVRFYAFGDGNTEGFQPEAGIINEARFDKTDLIFKTADEYGIRLIPVLTGSSSDYGGENIYSQWIGQSSDASSDIFYTNTYIKALYKNYINKFLTHKNNYTNIQYLNDPSILAWDIIDEPKISKDKQNELYSWTESVSKYIKRIDSNHLVTIGTDGIDSPTLENEPDGLCSIKNIDFCSVHFYIDNPVLLSSSANSSYLQEQADLGGKYRKPVVMEEVGVVNSSLNSMNPVTLLGKVVLQSEIQGYSGFLVLNWYSFSDTSSQSSSIASDYDFEGLKNIISMSIIPQSQLSKAQVGAHLMNTLNSISLPDNASSL